MNSVVLVGRLTFNPEVAKTENGKQVTHIVVAVNRNYKNADGIYETDFIKCTLWNGFICFRLYVRFQKKFTNGICCRA